MKGEELEEVQGAWEGEARGQHGESQEKELASHMGSTLTSPPHHLCGFTRTGQEPPTYFTGEETEALRGSMTCPRSPESW